MLKTLLSSWEALGRSAIAFLVSAGSVIRLIGETGYWVLRGWRSPGKHSSAALYGQMVRVGVRSVPLVILVNLFVGMIIAVSMASLLSRYGLLPRIADVVGVAVTRELAPLMTAIIMSGFVGAAMAAELGSMSVNDEILALETGAIPPVRFLVVPRMLAAVVTLPCLTVLADVAGVLGGYVVATQLLHIGGARYLELVDRAVYWQDLVRGVVKSIAFAVLITAIACSQGLQVTSGAEGVGRATTNSVVISIVALIVANLFFTTLFHYALA